jgi:hypothetical protein
MQHGCVIIPGMDHIQRIRDARTHLNNVVYTAHAALYDAITEALRDGARVQDVVEASEYHRNHIRRIAQAAGIPDLRRRPRKRTAETGSPTCPPL